MHGCYEWSFEKNYNIFLLFDYTTDQKGKWREFRVSEHIKTGIKK